MTYNTKGKMKKEDNYVAKEKVTEVEKFPILECKERGIRQETLDIFGVRAGLSQVDGKTVEAYYFPSFNKKGKIVGYMKQDLTKSKDEKGHWSAVGSVSLNNKLFGQDVAETVGRKRNNLVVTEGQWDTLSVYQSMVDSVKGTPYSGIEPFVCSIPLGTGNAVEALLHNEDFAKSFTGLTIFFDDDYCTPAEAKKGILKGHEAREAVANAFVGSKLSLFTVYPSKGYKDASDYMQNEDSKLLAKDVSFNKKSFSAEKIVKASDISVDELIAPRPEGVYVDSFPLLMEKIHGFRKRELVLLTSPSGVGKSTVTSFFANAFVEKGEKVGMIYLEETKVETLQRVIASKLKVNYLKFKNNPLSLATREQIEQAKREVDEGDKLVMLDHFGSLPISQLMQKIKHMHFVEGCNYILLDHLSVVISGSDIANERKELDIVMTELAAFCAANDVCIIAVSHINRDSISDQLKPKKGEEDKPFWIRVGKESMRGSASLEQLSFIVLALEPEIMPNRKRGRVRLVVLKNRPWGFLGQCDTFSVDDNTWEVVLSDLEEEQKGF
jgi:archaellum biogenesis ATPase FlaH